MNVYGRYVYKNVGIVQHSILCVDVYELFISIVFMSIVVLFLGTTDSIWFPLSRLDEFRIIKMLFAYSQDWLFKGSAAALKEYFSVKELEIIFYLIILAPVQRPPVYVSRHVKFDTPASCACSPSWSPPACSSCSHSVWRCRRGSAPQSSGRPGRPPSPPSRPAKPSGNSACCVAHPLPGVKTKKKTTTSSWKD